MTTGIIIRFHYKQDDPRFSWRYKHFVENVLPRILTQTYNQFDVCIWCNDWHRHFFESIGLKTFTVKEEKVKYKINGHQKYFHDFTPWESVVGLEKYDIQIGLDSDDYIDRNFVGQVVLEIEKNMFDRGNKSVHICFQPELIRLSTGAKEPMRIYHRKRGSAFMALFQPNKENYRFIYEESHISIIRKADIARVLPVGYCWAVAHDINESTGK